MRYLLDTNILSNITKLAPSEALMAWMADQVDTDLFISSLTVAEIRRGVLEKPVGKKRDQLEAWFSGPEGPQALFADRICSASTSMSGGDSQVGRFWPLRRLFQIVTSSFVLSTRLSPTG